MIGIQMDYAPGRVAVLAGNAVLQQLAQMAPPLNTSP